MWIAMDPLKKTGRRPTRIISNQRDVIMTNAWRTRSSIYTIDRVRVSGTINKVKKIKKNIYLLRTYVNDNRTLKRE